MKWGVRRFEDKSGHLTPAGKERYNDYDYPTSKQRKKYKKEHPGTTLTDREILKAVRKK